MKKRFAVIPIAILFFILLSSNINSYAASVGFTVRKISDSEWFTQLILYDFVDWVDDVSSDFTNGTIDRTMTFSTYQECINWVNNLVSVNGSVYANYVVPNGRIVYLNSIDNYYYQVAIPHRNFTTTINSYNSYDDFINPPTPTPEPNWYDDFVDWWDDEFAAFEYDVIDPILNIWDWVKSFFVDDPEVEQPNINDIIVQPSPTPTPIPYEVQIRTDPVTNNTSIVYVYNDTNNNTVVSNEPPAPYNPLPVSIGTGLGTGNSSDSGPQYYTNTDPISLPNLDWLNFDLDFDGNLISTLAGFGSGIETINAGTAEYTSGIEGIFSIFLQIPQDIYFVIGLSLSIILIAGIISRFLS